MYRCALVVFLLLSTGGALAADTEQGKESDKAQKAISFMKKLGIHNENVHDAARFVDGRMNDGYLELAKGDVEGMKLNLRYDADSVRMDNLELQMKFNQDDPYEVIASTEGVMFHFRVVW